MTVRNYMIAAAALAVAAPALADDAADIRAAETAWNAAIKAKDGATLDRWMSDDFELTGGPAATRLIIPRSAWRANLERMTISHYDTEVADVDVAGDYAIATIKGRWTVAFNGKAADERFLLRDVWVWRKTGWQVIRRYMVDEPVPTAKP